MLEDEKADEIIGTVRKLLKSFKLKAYNEDTRQGFLRHVLVKRGFKSGQIMVVLVTGTPEFPKKRSFVNALLSRHPEITTVVWNYNPKKTSLVLGEREEILVKDARENARLNKVENIRFFNADAGRFMVEAAKEGETADVVIMDPPRSGSDRAFLSSVVTLAPKKVVYISCNPETQKRDLMFLVKNGYKVRKIQPVDMFPHTLHVETVVQLVRVK